MGQEEFNKRLKTGDPFVKRVMKEKKIMLKESYDNIKRETAQVRNLNEWRL